MVLGGPLSGSLARRRFDWIGSIESIESVEVSYCHNRARARPRAHFAQLNRPAQATTATTTSDSLMSREVLI